MHQNIVEKIIKKGEVQISPFLIDNLILYLVIVSSSFMIENMKIAIKKQ
jgi:hypothetical protein